MSLHASQWASVLEELKKDLPWLLSWWHQAKLGNFEATKKPEEIDIKPLQEEK
jgi:hypothetical protein